MSNNSPEPGDIVNEGQLPIGPELADNNDKDDNNDDDVHVDVHSHLRPNSASDIHRQMVLDHQRKERERQLQEQERQHQERRKARRDHKLLPGQYEFYKLVFTELRSSKETELSLARLLVWEAVGEYTSMQTIPHIIKCVTRGEIRNDVVADVLTDGRNNVPWRDVRFGEDRRSEVVFGFPLPLVLSAYTFCTSDRLPQRDPIAWELYGANGDGKSEQQNLQYFKWKKLDERSNMANHVPMLRKSLMHSLEPQFTFKSTTTKKKATTAKR